MDDLGTPVFTLCQRIITFDPSWFVVCMGTGKGSLKVVEDGSLVDYYPSAQNMME